MMLEEVDWLLDEESCSDSEPEKYNVTNILMEKGSPMILVEAGDENPFVLPPREVCSTRPSVCSQLITARRQAKFAASKASKFAESIASKNTAISHLKCELERSSESAERCFMKCHDEYLRNSSQRGHHQLNKLTNIISNDISALTYEIESLQKEITVTECDPTPDTYPPVGHGQGSLGGDGCSRILFADDDQHTEVGDDATDSFTTSLAKEISLCNASANNYTDSLDAVNTLELEMVTTYGPRVLQPLQLQISTLNSEIRRLEDQLSSAAVLKKKATAKQLSLPVMGAPLKSSVLL